LRERERKTEARRGNGKKEGSGARGGVLQLKPRRGGGNVGERGAAWWFSNREREKSGVAVGEERADRRARPVSG
jgi:hypothetical protein